MLNTKEIHFVPKPTTNVMNVYSTSGELDRQYITKMGTIQRCVVTWHDIDVIASVMNFIREEKEEHGVDIYGELTMRDYKLLSVALQQIKENLTIEID